MDPLNKFKFGANQTNVCINKNEMLVFSVQFRTIVVREFNDISISVFSDQPTAAIVVCLELKQYSVYSFYISATLYSRVDCLYKEFISDYVH